MYTERGNQPEYQDFDTNTSWDRLLTDDLASKSLDYNQVLHHAEADPTFDAFSLSMPTDRSKYAIGRYVMSHGIDVPLITSSDEWRAAILGGNAMLRSDGIADYEGISGLLRSHRLGLKEVYPLDDSGNEDVGSWQYVPDVGGNQFKRLYEGPPALRPNFGDEYDWLSPSELASLKQKNARYIAGLLDMSVSPSAIMTDKFWRNDRQQVREAANEYGINIHDILPGDVLASLWKHIPGVNIRIFRDPVLVGKYYLGGQLSYHEWTVTEGRDSPDVSAYSKAHYRGRVEAEEPQYTLPTQRIIDLYEKIRTLPLFDQSQAPVMELLLGEDDTLYFLQYLKTGQVIADSGEFQLNEGSKTVKCHNVRGQTDPVGEAMRIYLDPRAFTPAMIGAGVYIDFDLRGAPSQYAAMNSKVAIIEPNLSFKDNHITSAPLFRPPVAIGLWDGKGDAWQKFHDLSEQQPFRTVYDPRDSVEYIEARVTSNGRQATIESDWVMRTQRL